MILGLIRKAKVTVCVVGMWGWMVLWQTDRIIHLLHPPVQLVIPWNSHPRPLVKRWNSPTGLLQHLRGFDWSGNHLHHCRLSCLFLAYSIKKTGGGIWSFQGTNCARVGVTRPHYSHWVMCSCIGISGWLSDVLAWVSRLEWVRVKQNAGRSAVSNGRSFAASSSLARWWIAFARYTELHSSDSHHT